MVLKSELTDKNHTPPNMTKKNSQRIMLKVAWDNKDINNRPVNKVIRKGLK